MSQLNGSKRIEYGGMRNVGEPVESFEDTAIDVRGLAARACDCRCKAPGCAYATEPSHVDIVATPRHNAMPRPTLPIMRGRIGNGLRPRATIRILRTMTSRVRPRFKAPGPRPQPVACGSMLELPPVRLRAGAAR